MANVKVVPGDTFAIPKGRFPSASEVLLSFACSGFIATYAQRHVNDQETFQSLAVYYQAAGVMPLQWAGLAVSAVIILATSAWFFTARLAPLTRVVVPVAAVVGIGLVYGELAVARHFLETATVEINTLPYGPINNGGFWGVFAFAAYLIFRLPNGRLGAGWGAFVKWCLAWSFLLANLMVWTRING